MRPTIHLSAVALVIGMVAAGCGGSKPAHSSSPKPARGGLSVRAYLDQVTAINQRLADSNSAYFHGSGGPAELRPLQAAYLQTADQLAALHPPAAAVQKQAKVVAFYRAAARRLAAILKRHPFNSNRANTVAISSNDSAGRLYSDLFTIPG